MWKFKASKFKNAAPKIPKKEEWVNDVSAANLLSSCGNHIQASAMYMAFNTDSGGTGCLGLLPIDDKGRKDVSMPLIHAHADFVTDFAFSPFDDLHLATGSQDCTVKLWNLPDGGIEEHLTDPLVTFPAEERRIENILWHPCADGLLCASSFKTIKLYDIAASQEKLVLGDHGDQIQSMSWREDGTALVTSCKDKKIRILDPRAGSVVQEAAGHQNIKDSRVKWLGDKDLIFSTGFDMMRQRELCIRDCRNLGQSLQSMSLGSSTGILMPLFDPDTNMLFLAGKTDTTLRFMEITESSPYITQASMDTVDQIKGAALVPKRVLDVMQCEVNRLLLLTKSAVIPVPYKVPRKSYREFHEDLFPETNCNEAALSAEEWLSGQNAMVGKMSLDPDKRRQRPAQRPTQSPKTQTHSPASHKPQPGPSAPQNEPKTETPVKAREPEPPATQASNGGQLHKPQASEAAPSKPAPPANKPTPSASKPVAGASNTVTVKVDDQECPVEMRQKKTPVFAGVRQSKFRHLKGTTVHKSQHIDNIRNLSRSIPGESDMFQVNTTRCAVPLSGSGGLITVLELDKPGRLGDTGLPVLQQGSNVTDFVWDPFDDSILAVGCDDGRIRLWEIPDEGLTETTTDPVGNLYGHSEKIYCLRYHPLASNVLASASFDMTLRIWDVMTGDTMIVLEGHTDTVFTIAWSPDGRTLATVCKDGKIRIYSPRESTVPIQEGPGPVGSRGARAVWVLDGKLLAISGFSRTSCRTIYIYDPSDLSKPLHSVETDTSPSILVPYYDSDSSSLFLTGRGDSSVLVYEVIPDLPYLIEMSGFKGSGLHQALAFLPKNQCNVREVEFARALRLTSNNIEPVSFTVPRVRAEFFQDDLFPDTKVVWEPTMTSEEWFSGANEQPQIISLRPTDMTLLSEAPVEKPKPKKFESYNPETYKTDEDKKEELLSAITGKLEIKEEPLPQDLTEGVDSDEWSD